ncbi:MAG: MoaD/ThiS family protein [Candidatus Tectomicrobia bacterium]|uniref:MoaD/ThiS family protein n=1 Tax=Tectimicrobiota bacterium TaxID=2528274 RepID=A0A932GN34_UNCTE|nr:MoaD/ThiS family protein [Candidatus Tectomicrobia bacterium]
MQVKVTFFGVIRDLVGNSPSVALDVRDGCTLKELLGVLCQRYGPDFGAGLMRDDGGVQPFVNIVLNGKTADSFNLEVPLSGNIDACQQVDIFIIPAFCGGQ